MKFYGASMALYVLVGRDGREFPAEILDFWPNFWAT